MVEVEHPRRLLAEGVQLFHRRARWLIVSTLIGLAILLAAATLSAIGYETGSSRLFVGFVWAVLPVPFYLLLILWLDRNEPEPLWAVGGVFIWGASVATFFALFINTYGQVFVAPWIGGSQADVFTRCVSAPIVEEVAKAGALLLFLWFWRDEFDGVVDGLVYASLVGLGFATTENVLYYARAAQSGDTLSIFVGRGIFTPYMHPLFTAVTGIGIGRAANLKRKLPQLLMITVCLIAAIGMHAFWNTSTYLSVKTGTSSFLIYFAVMVPLFLLTMALATLALHNERMVLKRHLSSEVETGKLTASELIDLCTFAGRQRAAVRAFREGGIPRLVLQLELYKAAGDLAFYRNRLTRIGPGEWNGERDAFYLERLLLLRAQVKGPI